MHDLQKDNTCALVIGGYLNSYSIIKELYEQEIYQIALFNTGISLSRYSNKIKYSASINNDHKSLLIELKRLRKQYDFIVPFPTDDIQLENLHKIHDEIKGFCYIPFNNERIFNSMNKLHQYEICQNINIPYPKTVKARTIKDLDQVKELKFPLLVKPAKSINISDKLFRTLHLEDLNSYLCNKKNLAKRINNGISFVISELIPGDDTNIYAYTCFRSQEGEILNEWSGKKLTQYPDNYGVFSSASNEAPEIITKQGRQLVEALDAFGIVEPEFKYDHRDNNYKLTETNLRSMMWHRLGNISGVKLHETQFNYATNKKITKYHQNKSESIHFVFMLHEICNLIGRKYYWKNFKYNVWGSDKRHWAVFELRDIKPFLYSLFILFTRSIAVWLKRIGLR